MKIVIHYESSWRNSFLDGSNNENLPKNGRNFLGSMTTLKKEGNFIQREITKDTVMGVLNRLIGEQAKLYQARQRPNYYFADIESVLKDSDIVDTPVITNELVYIRNVSGSEDQNSFTGLIKANDPAFNSPFSASLWGVLWLTTDQLLSFILDDTYSVTLDFDIDPISVSDRIEWLNSEKALDLVPDVVEALEKLNTVYPDVDYLTTKNQLPLVSLYASALYLQTERLKQHYDLSHALTKSGGLSGISKRGFTKKDFMAKYTTGAKKLVWGNPYLLKEKKKGEGEVISVLTKASGELVIHLDISKERARDLEEKINNAGVSAFYLGKKGLAYVEDIRI